MDWLKLPQVSPSARKFNLFMTVVCLFLLVVQVYEWQTSVSEMSRERDVRQIALGVGILLVFAGNLPERPLLRYLLFAGSVCCVTAVWILWIV